jgi:DNA-binding transcriptional ArsR family regulator
MADRRVGRAFRLALRADVPLPPVDARESGVSFLMNPRRLRLYEFVAREPGVHLRKAARELRVPTQSLRWHVKVLLQASLLREARLRGRAAYFCTGLVDEADDARFVSLQDALNRKIWSALARPEPLVQAELIRRLGTYEQRVSPHLRWMRDVGLLHDERENGHRIYRRSPEVDGWAARYEARREEREGVLLETLRKQGLAPRVVARSSTGVSVHVSSGRDATTLRFDLVPLPK